MAVYRKKQPARRPVRRGWKRHARTGMFLFAFALVAVTVGVILPHAGVMSAAAEGSTLTEKIFTTVQNKNLPVIAIDPGHGGTDPGSEGSGLWEYEMTWQVANELVNLLEQDDVKENLNYLHKWYVDGIINPDANVVTDGGKGAIFSTGQGWPAAAKSWAFGQGIEKYDVTKVFGPLYTTETIQGSMNAVSANSKYTGYLLHPCYRG